MQYVNNYAVLPCIALLIGHDQRSLDFQFKDVVGTIEKIAINSDFYS